MADLSWWDEDWDVVVAGGGGAGLMAAIEAAERGARVLLVEKQPGLGGATGMSVGTLSAAGTALQKAAGIQDSVDSWCRHFREGHRTGEFIKQLSQGFRESRCYHDR